MRDGADRWVRACWFAVAALLLATLPRYLTPFVAELARPGAASALITVDDAFYVQTLARNLARDGRFHISGIDTDGFQPLIVVLRGALAWALPDASPRAFLVVTFALQAALVATAAALLKRWYRVATGDADALGGWLVVALFLASRFVFLAYINPLETLLSQCLLLGFLIAEASPRAGWRRGVALGALGGLCFLARTDFVLFAGALTLVAAWEDRADWSRRARAPWLWTALALGALIALPWLLYCKLQFGSFVPRSGKATTFITHGGLRPWQVWSAAKLSNVASGLVGNLSILGASREPSGLLSGALGVPLTAMAWRWSFGALPRLARRLLALTAIYGLIYWLALGSLYDTWRYLSVLPLLALPIVARAVVTARGALRRVAVPTVALLVALTSLYTATRLRALPTLGAAPSLAALLARDPRTRDARVGAFNSGLLSWEHPHAMNLDGKIHHDAGYALFAGPASFTRWLDAQSIDWFADDPAYLATSYRGPDRWVPVTLAPGRVVYRRARAAPAP